MCMMDLDADNKLHSWNPASRGLYQLCGALSGGFCTHVAQNDFSALMRSSLGYFFLVNGSSSKKLFVPSSSHQYEFHWSEEKIRLRSVLRLNSITLP